MRKPPSRTVPALLNEPLAADQHWQGPEGGSAGAFRGCPLKGLVTP